ncbi:MAG TPA: LapA family protein [Acidimicrobiales bacterium]
MPTTSGDPGSGSAGRSVEKKRDTREVARLVAAGVGLILLVAFVLDNSQTVKVGFVVFSTKLSLIWVLLIAAVLGAVVDRLVILLRQRRKKAAAQH